MTFEHSNIILLFLYILTCSNYRSTGIMRLREGAAVYCWTKKSWCIYGGRVWNDVSHLLLKLLFYCCYCCFTVNLKGHLERHLEDVHFPAWRAAYMPSIGGHWKGHIGALWDAAIVLYTIAASHRASCVVAGFQTRVPQTSVAWVMLHSL